MNAIESAKKILDCGWSPIPLTLKTKRPFMRGWPTYKADPQNLDAFKGKNIGVLLGEKSGGLVDVDLDSEKAQALARYFLPSTPAIFGHGGVATHYLYYSDVEATEKHGEIEIRSTGGQTMFPGSTHPNGESIEWISDGEPAYVSADELRACVEALKMECEKHV